MAARLSMVSSRDSPLLAEDAEMFRLMTSADRRFEAISKVVRVRVEFSKNRLNTLLPRISGTFLTSVADADKGRRRVEDVVDDGLGQALDGEQVLQFAVFVQLRIKHGRLRWSAKGGRQRCAAGPATGRARGRRGPRRNRRPPAVRGRRGRPKRPA